MEKEGQENIVNLLRCAWAGSQKYGALVWSGDIASSFSSMRNQLAAGLNMGMAGIPWWTTDIGGFHGGDPDDPAFPGAVRPLVPVGNLLPGDAASRRQRTPAAPVRNNRRSCMAVPEQPMKCGATEKKYMRSV